MNVLDKTIGNQTLADKAKGYFERNPFVDCLFFTRDGLAFYKELDAKTHAKRLSKEVFKITRVDFEDYLKNEQSAQKEAELKAKEEAEAQKKDQEKAKKEAELKAKEEEAQKKAEEKAKTEAQLKAGQQEAQNTNTDK